MQRFIFSFSIIAGGLITGYVLRRIAVARSIPETRLHALRKLLQRVVLLGLNPLAALGAIWVFPFDNLRIAYLPLLGILTLAVGATSGLILGRAQKLTPTDAGALFSAGAMFNIGSIGALIVYVTLGQTGFALVPLFRLFEELWYYLVIFPIAKTFSVRSSAGERQRQRRILTILADPFILVSASSILLGFALNMTGVVQPGLFSRLNPVIIPLGSFLLLVSIGTAMRLGHVLPHLRSAVSVAVIKYAIVPVVVTAVGFALGLGRIDNGLPLKVVLILSSVPVGFIALVPPSLYHLNVDLANAAWLLTTLLLAVVIPLQSLLLGIM